MKISKVYTRSGDRGTTGIIGGARVPKDSLRIESYGTVDELQAVLGVLRAELQGSTIKKDACQSLISIIHEVQNRLFDLGSSLATPADKLEQNKSPIRAENISWLESTMDTWNEELEDLTSFILSGGGKFSAQAHLARTVCRRAERIALAFSREEPVAEENIKYLNRLSDFLFVLARHLAKLFGEEEPLWETLLKKDEKNAK